jgi:dUTPase
MSDTVLMLKLIKKDTESDEMFHGREKLYKSAIEKHNFMVFSTIKTIYGRNKFVGDEYHRVKYTQENAPVTCFEEIICEPLNGTQSYRQSYRTHSLAGMSRNYNPYFDSGFDIFQPLGKMNSFPTPQGETKSYDLEEGTHLIGLGLKTAMYTIDILQNVSNVELLRRITIYNNLHNITQESLEDYSTRRFDMIEKIDWLYQTPRPFKLHPRSSIYKKAIRQANCTGIIDSGYRGELCAAVDCLGERFGKQTVPNRMALEFGKRYFQICKADLQPFYVVLLNENSELPSTERGGGGFGSTGQ